VAAPRDADVKWSALQDRTPALKAIAEFDELGRDAFLQKYGFGRSTHLFVRHDGRRYDIKALAGATHGYADPAAGPLTNNAFSSGKPLVDLFRRLGFEVESTSDRSMLDHARTLRDALQEILTGYLDGRVAGGLRPPPPSHRTCESPASGVPGPVARGVHRSATRNLLQPDQTEIVSVLVEVHSRRRPVGALAAAPEVHGYALLGVANEVPAGARRMTLGEVAKPAAEDRVDLGHNLLYRLEALLRAGQLPDLVARTLLRLRRRLQPPVSGPATRSVAAAIPEPVAEEVEEVALVSHLHDARLLAVDGQP